jgi:hypothetical protein
MLRESDAIKLVYLLNKCMTEKYSPMHIDYAIAECKEYSYLETQMELEEHYDKLINLEDILNWLLNIAQPTELLARQSRANPE